MKSKVKLFLTNFAIASVDIFCFSKVGLGLSFSSPNIVNKSLSVTVLLMSVILFGYLNSKILFAREKKEELPVLESVEVERDMEYYIEEITKISGMRSFAKQEIFEVQKQHQEFKRKVTALQRVIDLNGGKSAQFLWDTVEDVKASITRNFKQILTKLVILDYDDDQRYNRKFRKFILGRIARNNEILDLFDDMLDEVSRMKDELDFENTSLLSTIEALQLLRGISDGETQEESASKAPRLNLKPKAQVNTQQTATMETITKLPNKQQSIEQPLRGLPETPRSIDLPWNEMFSYESKEPVNQSVSKGGEK